MFSFFLSGHDDLKMVSNNQTPVILEFDEEELNEQENNKKEKKILLQRLVTMAQEIKKQQWQLR